MDTNYVMSTDYHIDNGEHTFKIDEEGNFYIETGFFGYSNTEVYMCNPGTNDYKHFKKSGDWLRHLANEIIIAADKVDLFVASI